MMRRRTGACRGWDTNPTASGRKTSGLAVVVLAMVAVECSRTHLHLLDAAEYQQPTLDHMRILLYCCGFMPKASSSGDVACRRIEAAVRLFGRTIFRSRLVPPVGLEPTLEPF